MNKIIMRNIKENIEIKKIMISDKDTISKIKEIANSCITCLKNNGKIIFAGNGGSFADAQHLSAEFVSRFKINRRPLASVSLGVNGSTISAIGNDYGFNHVFSRELKAIGFKGDVVIGLTTSGNSKNIINLIKVTNQIQCKAFILTGKNGGLIKDKTICLHVPSDNTARIQECHILIGHILCEIIEAEIFLNE